MNRESQEPRRPREPGDADGFEAAVRRLAWVLDQTIRIRTATTPEAVRAALRALAERGVEPNRWVVRLARARLAVLGSHPAPPGGPTTPERSHP
jgi:hypothetical protein